MKKRFLFLLVFVSCFCFSQELIYKSGGRIFNSEGKMSPNEVRELLKNEPGMLQFYNSGRGQKTFGNILFYGGLMMIPADFLIAAGNEGNYPTLLTYLGVGSLVLSIPVKSGYTKKIKTVVNDYNKKYEKKNTSIESINLITTRNGIGFEINF